jgi:hypothetical protein
MLLLFEDFTKNYAKWKKDNVTLRGIKTLGKDNNVNGLWGRGLYTVPLSNKSMAKQYGDLYFVVNARPKNVKIVSDISRAEEFMYSLYLEYCRKHNYLETDYDDVKKYFTQNTDIATEMIENGFDGFEIKGREIVHYKPEHLFYFKNEDELISHFNSL